MGPHQLAPGNITSAMPSSSHALSDGKKRAFDEKQRALVKPACHQEGRDLGTTHGKGQENTEPGPSESSLIRSKKSQKKLVLKTKVEAKDFEALRKESEYRVLVSSEDAVDDDWVMVDMSKLILK